MQWMVLCYSEKPEKIRKCPYAVNMRVMQVPIRWRVPVVSSLFYLTMMDDPHRPIRGWAIKFSIELSHRLASISIYMRGSNWGILIEQHLYCTTLETALSSILPGSLSKQLADLFSHHQSSHVKEKYFDYLNKQNASFRFNCWKKLPYRPQRNCNYLKLWASQIRILLSFEPEII